MTQQIDLEAIAALAHRAMARANVRAVSTDMESVKVLCADAQNLADAVLALVERVGELDAGPVMPEEISGDLLSNLTTVPSACCYGNGDFDYLGFCDLWKDIRAVLLKEQVRE